MVQEFAHNDSSTQGDKNSQAEVASVALLKTLAYFDLFHYPLTREELQNFSSVILTTEQLDEALSLLVSRQFIFLHDGFYLLQDNPLLVYRRKQGNQRAVPLIRKAASIGRFLYQFPFVKAIGVSGSLSKNYANEKDDIDFFIVTSANRLWIARTCMHLFKKLTYLTGRQHHYCMNYFIDEEALALSDRNIFTATELKTLLPIAGHDILQQFQDMNTWADEWLPACKHRTQTIKDSSPNFVKKCSQWVMSSKIFNSLDDYLLRITTRRWNRKQASGAKNAKGLQMGLITGKHFAKSNAGNFQEKILTQYRQKVTILLDKLS